MHILICKYVRSPLSMAISWSYVDLLFNFCQAPHFFLKRHNLLSFAFFFCWHLFFSIKLKQFLFIYISFFIRLLSNASQSVFVLFFLFWLLSSLSHPMTIFSANEIRTFFVKNHVDEKIILIIRKTLEIFWCYSSLLREE